MERYNGSVEGYDNVVWPKGTPDSEIEASVATMERQRLKHNHGVKEIKSGLAGCVGQTLAYSVTRNVAIKKHYRRLKIIVADSLVLALSVLL